MKKAGLFVIPLLLGLSIVSWCVLAGVSVGGHGAGMTGHPLGVSVSVD